MRRMLGALGALTLLGAMAWVAGAPPARAAAQQPIVIGIGQTVTRSYPAIPGDNSAQSDTPAHCRSTTGSPSCDDVPITLAVDPSTLKTRSYSVNATVTWQTQTVQTAVGPQQSDQLDLFFWQNPPSVINGSPSYDTTSEGNPSPTEVSIVNPQSVKLDLVVAHTHGINHGYTVSISTVDNDAPPPVDHSVDTVVDRSNTSQFPVSSTPPATPASAPGPATPAETVAAPTSGASAPLAPITPSPDPQLDAIRAANDRTLLGLGVAKKIGTIHPAPNGPAPAVSALALMLALGVLPAGVAAGALIAWRRRRSSTSIG